MNIREDLTAEVVLNAAAGLGEGPCWDHRAKVLWWVDVTHGLLHQFNPETRTDEIRLLPSPASAVMLRRSGGLVLALRKGYHLYEPTSGEVQLLCAVEPSIRDNRLNDAKADSRGRIWGGTMADDEARGAGAFYRYEPSGSLDLVWDKVTCSNGIGWSPDGRLMYYVDSGERRVDVCTFDATSGTVSDRRAFAHIDPPAEPDGLAIDAEGAVWVALWAGSGLRRYLPNGRLDGTVRLPALNVTSCAFGGDELDVLYITSATTGTTAAQRAEHPHCGALFALRPGVRGMEDFRYDG